jgi:hemerythrin-like domain-containing protein
VFFPALEARGIPRGLGPIACMLQEHDIGRAHVVAAREALRLTAEGNTTAQAIVRQQTGEFVSLLRDHIAKENQILFVMGDRLLTDDDRTALLERFDQADATGLPPGTTDRCVSLARELRREAGLGDEPPRPVTVSGHTCHH